MVSRGRRGVGVKGLLGDRGVGGEGKNRWIFPRRSRAPSESLLTSLHHPQRAGEGNRSCGRACLRAGEEEWTFKKGKKSQAKRRKKSPQRARPEAPKIPLCTLNPILTAKSRKGTQEKLGRGAELFPANPGGQDSNSNASASIMGGDIAGENRMENA